MNYDLLSYDRLPASRKRELGCCDRIHLIWTPLFPSVDVRPLRLFLVICLGVSGSLPANADEYQENIQPYMKSYCMECHAGAEAKGELDLTKFSTNADVIDSFRRWKHVIEFVRECEMPPEDAKQPTITESNQVVAAIEAILISEARKHAGDPGVVLPRRLSNTEYNLAVRDLTGVDMRPTKDFPVDPAGGEGFDNTGEALRMSPNLLKKYLGAAQQVADHLVLKPSGIVFAPFPVTSYNERKKLTEQAVIDFYRDHSVNTLDYMEAAWRYRHRTGEQAELSIEEWASVVFRSAKARPFAERKTTLRAERKATLSPQYLAIVWRFLNATDPVSPLRRELQAKWNAILAPTSETERPAELLEFVEYVQAVRKQLSGPPPELIKAGAGNWPISHLAYRTEVAKGRDQFNPTVLKSEALLNNVRVTSPDAKSPLPRSIFIRIEPAYSHEQAYVLIQSPMLSRADHRPRNADEWKNHRPETLRSLLSEAAPALIETLQFGRDPDGKEIDADSFIIKVPALIDIPLSVDLQRELQGQHLLLPCSLDLARSPNGSVLVSTSWEKPTSSRLAPGVQHLVNANSPIARELTTTAAAFCHTFPDEFYYVDNNRGLAAGFHLVEGFFRDDRPLVEKVLSDAENAELDKLWQELDFVTESSETLLRGFVWFERSEREVLHDERFDFLRAEDPQLVEESLLGKFERLYLDKLGVKRVGDTLEVETPSGTHTLVHGFFNDIRKGLARHQELLVSAEARGLEDLERLARRAYRRPLRAEELESLRSLYRSLRAEGQSVEGALRGVLTAILMSPHFCYHIPQASDGPGVYPLSDDDLATRLSLFLWSSLPDEELLSVAAEHGLQDEQRLLAQMQRMLKDPHVNGFAREFFGQWLRYRDYLEKDPIHAAAFPGYTDELRASIFEEPVQLATHLIQTDRPVTDLLSSDVTFVNRALAAHYGGAIQQQYQAQSGEEWRLVQHLKSEGRGGLMGMAVILTKNSVGERTSPVKRGFWAVHHLLGQHFPPPPADVPELPKSEKEATRTIRELLADHVSNTQCAMCHKHFDSLGLAMEGFDALGRARTQDSAGRPIDNRAELPNGTSAKGIPELIQYIEQHRRQEFIRTLNRKFLGYALGRSVKLSDEPLLTEMEAALEAHEFRFSALFEVVIRSPQFRQQRGRDFVSSGQP